MEKTSLSLGWAVAITCSLLLLSGCDKLNAVDVLSKETAANTAEIDALKTSLANSRKETETLRSQVISMYDRIAAVEKLQTAQAKASSAPPAPAALGPQEVAVLKVAIDACVQVGRAVPGPKYQADDPMTKGFDAYYHPASGTVRNNVRYEGEMPALYAFNKCMVSKGFPLG